VLLCLCKARATGAPTQLIYSSRVFRNCSYPFHLCYSRPQEVLPSQFPISHYLFKILSSLPRSFSSQSHGILTPRPRLCIITGHLALLWYSGPVLTAFFPCLIACHCEPYALSPFTSRRNHGQRRSLQF
jgi:hypothetical protein